MLELILFNFKFMRPLKYLIIELLIEKTRTHLEQADIIKERILIAIMTWAETFTAQADVGLGIF
jgi:hypothetical protein